MKSQVRYYHLALIIGLVFHGTLMFFTFEKTYDAYVHIFFADHYAENWFETWNYKWYTGFTITSYPPLVHQIIALLSYVVGLKLGFLTWGMMVVLLFVRGVYRFSMLWVDQRSAEYAALAAVFCSSFVEAIHVFGQLPSMTGLSLLLNACPEIYNWLRHRSKIHFVKAVLVLALTTTAHHVSTIFGMVFFVFPVLGLALLDRAVEEKGSIDDLKVKDFILQVWKNLPRVILFGAVSLFILISVVFPYWYWSKTDPITQVSIPHGSRDSFIETLSSGLVFFLIPWGMMLFFLPYLFKNAFRKRNIFLGLSLALMFLLGTGGTTPLPKMLLGDTAFNILTLDRFTLWATMLALPFWGAFLRDLFEGTFYHYLKDIWAGWVYRFTQFLVIGGILAFSLFIINIGYFRSLQPESIETDPITNFLNKSKHYEWRYLTLGFGDQMAWLAANTQALSVDGNYHSVRRLPEMTSRAVERLENAKYQGMEGIGALQQFLTVPDKYNLKYIFSNDKFYDPLLYFTGWQYLQVLENGIAIWERPDVAPLPSILPRKTIPDYQRMIWGIVPITVLILVILMKLFSFLYRQYFKLEKKAIVKTGNLPDVWSIHMIWIGFMACVFIGSTGFMTYYNQDRISPDNLIKAYFHAIDYKYFETAHQFYDPENRKSIDQFMLEISLEDGILASYAKLDGIDINYKKGDQKDELIAEVKADWITALMTYDTEHTLRLKKKGTYWYLLPEGVEKRIPSDQFIQRPELSFFNQGRRKAVVDLTEREDVLDRPQVDIISSSLVSMDSSFHVVGEIQNIDNDPSYITVSATLYDENNNELVSYNAKDIVVHNLLPKERTPFRIDFESTQWVNEQGQTFNPSEFNPMTFESTPTKFVVNVKSIVTDVRQYKSMGIQNTEFGDQQVTGEMINYGTREINIPHLLLGYYKNNQVYWVDDTYLERGIRPQRKKPFEIKIIEKESIKIISVGTDDNMIINGTARSYIQNPNRNKYNNKGIQIFPDGYAASGNSE